MTKRPTKADRMLAANYLRGEADAMRRAAARDRKTPPTDAERRIIFDKFATQNETRAARFERVADWMVAPDAE